MMHIAQNLFEFIEFSKCSTTRVVVLLDGHGDSFGSFLKQEKKTIIGLYITRRILCLYVEIRLRTMKIYIRKV